MMVAGTDSSVLILGETGTGKELIARAIHRLSPRKKKPFIKVDCGALPIGLIESELFGHEKGSFTGAVSRRAGRFELADRGTIFLDEIGAFPQDVQAKLLRVLQHREFERVGGARTIRVDDRVIAATHRRLADAVEAHDFRSDLYYRLNVFPIHLPPLRERREDVPLLAEHFLAKYVERMQKPIRTISRETMDRLTAYPWPGNIRELESVIERAVVMSQGSVLEVEDQLLPQSYTLASSRTGDSLPVPQELAQFLEVLRRVNGNRSKAARILGISRTTLWRKLKAHWASHENSSDG
jgi:formate hydrogenlyase transcriptional activator